jgi:hypothetical protein
MESVAEITHQVTRLNQVSNFAITLEFVVPGFGYVPVRSHHAGQDGGSDVGRSLAIK